MKDIPTLTKEQKLEFLNSDRKKSRAVLYYNLMEQIDKHKEMEVYDVLGQVVHVLINSELEAGYHTVKWNASGVSSGMYFYRLTAGDFSACRKMLLLR